MVNASHPLSLDAILWTADPVTQATILAVLAVGALAFATLYLPIILRILRLRRLGRTLGACLEAEPRAEEALRSEIATAFADSPLEPQWQDFAARWERAEATPGRAPVRLVDVFDDRPILPTGARKSLLPSLPGLLIAVGLLGSFAGLVGAVEASALAEEASAARRLAEQVGLALRSGLWGLILAIFAATTNRLLDGAFERMAEQLDGQVARAFSNISTAELATLTASAQRQSLEQMANQITRFANELTERIDRGLMRIEHSTSNAANLVSQEQRGILQAVVRDLSLQIQQGVEQHLGALSALLHRASEHQERVNDGLSRTFDQMGSHAKTHVHLTGLLERAASDVEAASRSFSETSEGFLPVLDGLRQAGTALEATAGQMNTTQHHVTRSAEDVRSSLEHAAAAMNEQREFIESGLGEMRGTIDALSAGLGENLNQALRSVDDALGRTVGRLRETIEESNETIDRMSSPVRAAEGTAREMHTALERVRSELLGLGDWLGQSLKPLRTTFVQLEDRAGEITRALSDFGDHTHAMDKTMDALRGEIHEEGRRIRQTTGELSRHLDKTADAVQRLERSTSRVPRAEATRVMAPSPPPPPTHTSEPIGPGTPPPIGETSPMPAMNTPLPPPPSLSALSPLDSEEAPSARPGEAKSDADPFADPFAATDPTPAESDAGVAESSISSPAPSTFDVSGPAEGRRPAGISGSGLTSRFLGESQRGDDLAGVGLSAAAGRPLGPDPYARRGAASESSSALTDDDLVLEEAPGPGLVGSGDELTLSGLLRPTSEGEPDAAASNRLRELADSDREAAGPEPEPEPTRPKTWRLLGKE